ncbi:MAG: Flp family type IVb pilin [Pseudomonadota bacterium]
MYKSIAHFMKNEDGATAIEYALIAAATGLALIAVMPAIGVGVQNSFNSVAAGL